MDVQKKKKRIVNSSAAILSLALHAALLLLLGGMVALRLYKKRDAGFQVEEQKPRLERRQLQMPVKTEPFVEQMSKPALRTTSRIVANTPQMVNIPEQGEYVKMAPMPTFKAAYTNFVRMDRTLEFNSKYRDVSFGISSVDFFGTRGAAEKVVVVVDASKSMLLDERGGPDSYRMVKDDLRETVGNMRPATLFNVVLFDNDAVALFNPVLVPATAAAKSNVLAWIEGVNTNLAQAGLSEGMANYAPKRRHNIPMEQPDLTGWLKGLQAAAELKPEIIFVLSADWGGITSLERNISYFPRQAALEEYQKRRADYFLQNAKAGKAMEQYMAEYEPLRAAALKMLELENQARTEAGRQPKVVRDWEEMLRSNNVRMPDLPLAAEQAAVGMSPVETRYTLDEVLETFFVIVMENYRHQGFPKMHFVMLSARGAPSYTAEAASRMTSEAKFRALAQMVGGRFRTLQGMPRVGNVLRQSPRGVAAMLDEEQAGGM